MSRADQPPERPLWIEKGLNRNSLDQLVRYGIVGLSLNGAAYLLYLFLTVPMGFDPRVIVSILYPFSVMVSYALNRSWTFNDSGRIGRSFARFIIAHVGGYLLNLALLIVFWQRLGFSHQIVQAAAIFVVAAYLFVLMRHFVFTVSSSKKPTADK